MSTIAVLGTLDPQGASHAFVATLIRTRGHGALFNSIRNFPEVSHIEYGEKINCPAFARARAERLLSMFKNQP
jgi:hypothetical protein